MGAFFGALFLFLLLTYLDAPNLKEIGMDRDEIKYCDWYIDCKEQLDSSF